MGTLTGQEQALMDAAQSGDLETLKALIAQNVNVDVQDDDDDSTALICAAYLGQIDVIKLLIGCGADLNIQNKWGNTALVLAAASGHVECVKLLIDAGADLDIKNNSERTALGEAVSGRRNENVIELLKREPVRRKQEKFKRQADAMTAVVSTLQNGPRRPAPALKRRRHSSKL